MSTQEKENPWVYSSLDEVPILVAPYAIGMILAIPALMYILMKKKSLQDTEKNVSYSRPSIFILSLIIASMIAYFAL